MKLVNLSLQSLLTSGLLMSLLVAEQAGQPCQRSCPPSVELVRVDALFSCKLVDRHRLEPLRSNGRAMWMPGSAASWLTDFCSQSISLETGALKSNVYFFFMARLYHLKNKPTTV